MKRKLYKAFRHARRKMAQYIVGFDTCPAQYKKNRKQDLLKLIGLTMITATVVMMFVLFTLWAT
jgi:hypothetical protein